MLTDADFHLWSPVVLALTHPGFLYTGGFIVFGIAAFIWWWLPWYNARKKYPSDPKSAKRESTALRNNLSIFYTGSVVVLGIIGIIIQFQFNIERDQQQERLALASSNNQFFAAAVKQLRESSDLAQLGALFNLANLMKQEGLYWPSVVEVHEFFRQAVGNADKDNNDVNVNTALIKNALRILSLRDKREGSTDLPNRDREPFPLNFSDLNLPGLQFDKLDMWSADFKYTNLSDALLPGAMIADGYLVCANFEGAHLDSGALQTNSRPAELGGDLSYANFHGANLRGVKFKSRTEMNGACFKDACLYQADISELTPDNLKSARGLTIDQIKSTVNAPNVSADFTTADCEDFKKLCPLTRVDRGPKAPVDCSH